MVSYMIKRYNGFQQFQGAGKVLNVGGLGAIPYALLFPPARPSLTVCTLYCTSVVAAASGQMLDSSGNPL